LDMESFLKEGGGHAFTFLLVSFGGSMFSFL
jgi:hypothetical protein